MTAPDPLAQIRERVAAATPGPWEIARYPHSGGRIFVGVEDVSMPRRLIADAFNEGDREFLFAARTDMPRLIAALDAVLAMHKPMDPKGIGHPDGLLCSCMQGFHGNCLTVRAITDALGGESR